MDKSDSVTEVLKALSVFQGQLENVEKAKTGHGYKYATLGNCIDAAKVALAANGLSVIQLLGNDEQGNTTMETILGHSSGEFISSICTMPVAKLAGGGAGNPAQVLGASITYLRRYQYAAIIGLAQDDTDGVPQNKKQQPQGPTVNDMSWVKACKEDENNYSKIIDPAYKTKIELFIKEGY